MTNEQTRFDCIAMKREAQENIYDEVKGMTPEEEIAYFRRAVASSRFKEWWDKIGASAEKDSQVAAKTISCAEIEGNVKDG